MKLVVAINPEPIPRGWPVWEDDAGAGGARVEFYGLVRAREGAQTIAALEYEAYAPMAEKVLRTMLEELLRKHGGLSAAVRHRTGIVPVGAIAIAVAVTCPHRQEGFALLIEFLDRLKQEVPIWKVRALPAS